MLPAAAAIDWTNPGQRIGDRAKPLAAKTMARIEAGLRRYARPVMPEAAGNTFEHRPGMRSWPIDDPLRTVHTTASKAPVHPQQLMTVGPGGLQEMSARQGGEALLHGLLVPVEGRKGKAAQGSGRPLRAQTARNETGLLVPAGGTTTSALPASRCAPVRPGRPRSLPRVTYRAIPGESTALVDADR